MSCRTPAVLLLACALAAVPASPARDRAPGFQQQSLDLPGIPAAILPADMDGDGHDDLVVLVAYTGWTTRAEFAPAKFDDVEGLVEVMNVVDELVDRRELRVYAGLADGAGFGAQLAAMDLESSVHALSTRHPGESLVAVTDDGAAAVRMVREPDGAVLTVTPLVAAETSFAGTGRFYPELDPLLDLDGDGLPELLLPTAAGWAVFRGLEGGFANEPSSAISLPEPRVEVEDGAEDAEAGEGVEGDDRQEEVAGSREVESDSGRDGDSDSDSDDDSDRDRPPHEIPVEAVDLDGDGHLELLLPEGAPGRGPLIYRGAGELSFAAAVEILPAGGDKADEAEREVMFVGDLDGDGRGEAVDRTQLERYEDPGWRQEVDEAKRPLFAYAVRPLGPGLLPAAAPRLDFQATGYTFGGSEGDDEDAEIQLPGGFQDLDGDGLKDLVAITLEFSALPLAMKILVVKRISLTMNFHVFCQTDEGGFREVPGLDLAGRFKLNLDNLRVRHLSQFAGDFDGDGRADFVQLGRGRAATIHLGRAACRYPTVPDRSIKLRRKLRHLGLARVVDLDGDGRSDLYVVHPGEAKDEQVSIPARVDLYLSRF